jgi:hypothetical protein
MRYWLGVIIILTVPAVVFIWTVIHPFIRFWKRLGTRLGYYFKRRDFAFCSKQ